MAKALSNDQYAWIPPESIARQRAEEASGADELRELFANPPGGEYREIKGYERDENGALGPVWGRLVQRVIVNSKGDCDFVIYEGKQENYRSTAEGKATND